MPGLSTADHRVSPPRLEIPRDYNAAHDLLARNAARPGSSMCVMFGVILAHTGMVATCLKCWKAGPMPAG